jgi:uncharacterized protein (UPF0305 family)
MRPITFVRGDPATLPEGVLFRGNWLKLKGPGDIAYCPLPNRGDGWVLTRLSVAPVDGTVAKPAAFG